METGSLDGVKAQVMRLRNELAFLHSDEVRGGGDHDEEKKALLERIRMLQEGRDE